MLLTRFGGIANLRVASRGRILRGWLSIRNASRGSGFALQMKSYQFPVPDWLQAYVQRGEALSKVAGVVIVANVKGQTTPLDDYCGDSIITEFLSGSELDDILSYFEAAGFYSEVVLDEQGFVQWISDRRPKFPRQHALIYNLAQNGTGPARLALVAGLCRLNGLALLDSDTYSVAIAQHKFHSACLLKHFGLPVPRCWFYSGHGWWPDVPATGLRLIAKPSYESASIGIDPESVFVMGPSAEADLLARTITYRQPLTIQEFISGFEVEVPVLEGLGPETLAAIGIAVGEERYLADQILTYERVFGDGYSFYDFGEQNHSWADEAMKLAKLAFRGLELHGIRKSGFPNYAKRSAIRHGGELQASYNSPQQCAIRSCDGRMFWQRFG